MTEPTDSGWYWARTKSKPLWPDHKAGPWKPVSFFALTYDVTSLNARGEVCSFDASHFEFGARLPDPPPGEVRW